MSLALALSAFRVAQAQIVSMYVPATCACRIEMHVYLTIGNKTWLFFYDFAINLIQLSTFFLFIFWYFQEYFDGALLRRNRVDGVVGLKAHLPCSSRAIGDKAGRD